jgi:crotonobetainyl-CoA:carnitine CoA-transferase CaiB-like acyl-CoA transferase
VTRPLDGVRVLDLTRLLPGAYGTLLLADLGADVIKIEDPRGGDQARQMPPLVKGSSVYFQILNRNKRSVTLDLRSPEAPAVLDALIAHADVVVDSFRPRTAQRLGVDPATLRARHPRLVSASITGFGQTGPYVDRAAHDINYEALVGLLMLGARPPSGTGRAVPRVPRLLIGDIGAALNTVAGILAALFQRERTGAGAVVDISIHESALAWMLFPSARSLVAGGEQDPNELPLTGENACYNIYETKDREWLALGALESKFWAGFCERIDRPDLASRQYATGQERARVLGEVREIMRSRTRDEWLARFADADVCLTPVNSLDQALTDPHIAARGVVAREAGTTYFTLPGVTVVPAPAIGANTDELLDEAGIDAAGRARLRAAGVIGA